ncbi:MAG: hypothetical protein WCK43_06685 [bacterium]
MNIIITYIIYLIFSCSFTFWVGKNLHRNGKIFLLDSCYDNEKKADSINQLLLVGFYLINFGFVSLFLSIGQAPSTLVESVEYLATKIGIVLMVLGGMHFFNMKNISRMSAKAITKSQRGLV